MPLNWVDDLRPAFGVVAAHQNTPETFGFAPDIPTLRNTAIVGNRFDDLPMFASRLTPVDSNPNDSGWFIGSNRDDVNNNDPDQLKQISLYEAMLAVPHVLDFLSMPVGCQVVFFGGNPVVLKDYKEFRDSQWLIIGASVLRTIADHNSLNGSRVSFVAKIVDRLNQPMLFHYGAP